MKYHKSYTSVLKYFKLLLDQIKALNSSIRVFEDKKEFLLSLGSNTGYYKLWIVISRVREYIIKGGNGIIHY